MILTIKNNDHILSAYEINQFDEKLDGFFQAHTLNGILIIINYEQKSLGYEKTLEYYRKNPDMTKEYPYYNEELKKLYGPKAPPHAHGPRFKSNEWTEINVITDSGNNLFSYKKN